jgi:hypothetical protein
MNYHPHTSTTLFMMMLAAIVAQLAGCSDGGAGNSTSPSGSTPATVAGSCNNAASGFCNEFTGSSYKAASVQRACDGQKMKFQAGACPTEGRVGSCLVYKGKNTESRYRYYTNFPGFGVTPKGGVAAAAESQCTKLKGEWTPD